MAAFMLHQAAEQALHTLLLVGTHYSATIHNLERLLRYTVMAYPQLLLLFPANTEAEKRLMPMLQKAYSDARYKTDYSINTTDLLTLAERVKQLQQILKTAGNSFLQPKL